MPKSIWKNTGFAAIILMVSGCAASKDIKMSAYVQEKPRVDQEIATSQPVGNWQNAPMAVDPERKPTRKVYVMEMTKETEGIDIDSIEVKTEGNVRTTTTTTKRTIPQPSLYEAPNVEIPPIQESDRSQGLDSAATSFVAYTVEKDDTLQKISKKFYDSYSKWPRIYNANKDVIKNPDFLQPGLKLQIPVAQ